MRPKINIMKIIADQIATEQARQEKREYRIVMVPRKVRIRVNCCKEKLLLFLLFTFSRLKSLKTLTLNGAF